MKEVKEILSCEACGENDEEFVDKKILCNLYQAVLCEICNDKFINFIEKRDEWKQYLTITKECDELMKDINKRGYKYYNQVQEKVFEKFDLEKTLFGIAKRWIEKQQKHTTKANFRVN